MNAVKRQVVVGKDRRIVVELPSDAPVGPAEVIVLMRAEEEQEAGDEPMDVEAFLNEIEEWRAAHPEYRRSKEDIDRELAEERASWEPEPGRSTSTPASSSTRSKATGGSGRRSARR